MRRGTVAACALAALATTAAPSSGAPAPAFTTALLPASNGGTEPRITVARDGTPYVVTNAGDMAGTVFTYQVGFSTVFGSRDGGRSWQQRGLLAGQTNPTIDVDIVALPTGRLVASEMDGPVLSFKTSYSDDAGKTWTDSTGLAALVDTDRQWFAVGPVDQDTGQPVVHFVYHNLYSGFGAHGVFIQTSRDGGASFGAPVPVTVPGDQAFSDLQCGDGYPSSISVNPVTGQIYVAFIARGASPEVLGGCGASLTPGPAQINIITATRLWVATSPDGSLGSWRQSLAVDRTATGQVVAMQFAPLALDRAGNAYLVFPESRDAQDMTAAIKYVWAPPDLSRWSAPVTLAPLADAGNLLPQVVAGDRGRVAFAWLHGRSQGTDPAAWRMHAAFVSDAMAPRPTITRAVVGGPVAYTGTAKALLGQCSADGPAAGLLNGLTCGRAVDNYGIALGRNGRMLIVWSTEADTKGTFVSVQRTGPVLLSRPS